MKVYDVSMTIKSGMAVYKNRLDKQPLLVLEKTFSKDGLNESSISMNLHTGTHIDAPFHMSEKGEGIESIDLNSLMRECRVLDLTYVEDKITRQDLMNANIEAGSFLLFKTKNSFSELFLNEFIYLDREGAEYLSEMNISGVGIDALGIERNQPEHDTHKILFSGGIVVIEGLRLKDVKDGPYWMCALPLKIEGVDGAPARVVLMEA